MWRATAAIFVKLMPSLRLFLASFLQRGVGIRKIIYLPLYRLDDFYGLPNAAGVLGRRMIKNARTIFTANGLLAITNSPAKKSNGVESLLSRKEVNVPLQKYR
ncbi:hypothetical protein CDAR_431271 [Caerostris darwini]|uniref:Uncharacterized protein n=1 Tax=Caerostris darwini TaxID=1538125 RepID=A0AAV4RQA3_9ARAC|nr:hypothetical protein CDAR_431271 [Caerostris darwini]